MTHLKYLLDLLGGGGLGLGPALVVPGVRLHHGADHQLGPAPGPALLETEDIYDEFSLQVSILFYRFFSTK